MGQRRHELVSAPSSNSIGRVLTVVLRPVDIAVLEGGGGRIRGRAIVSIRLVHTAGSRRSMNYWVFIGDAPRHATVRSSARTCCWGPFCAKGRDQLLNLVVI